MRNIHWQQSFRSHLLGERRPTGTPSERSIVTSSEGLNSFHELISVLNRFKTNCWAGWFIDRAIRIERGAGSHSKKELVARLLRPNRN